jgi:hypothetical protein
MLDYRKQSLKTLYSIFAVPFAIVGSIVGNVGGAVVGSLFKVQSVAGVVDLQIQERTDTPVTGVVRTDARQGTSTVLSTQQAVQSNYQTFRILCPELHKKRNADFIVMRSPLLASPANTLFWPLFTPHKRTRLQRGNQFVSRLKTS